ARTTSATATAHRDAEITTTKNVNHGNAPRKTSLVTGNKALTTNPNLERRTLTASTDLQAEIAPALRNGQACGHAQSSIDCEVATAAADCDLTDHEPAALDKSFPCDTDQQKLDFALNKMTEKTNPARGQTNYHQGIDPRH
uniref:Uncharacterized protein n=1 Tax=Romanomermis culicivorax TaxID=13658 RepID=A0A915KM75_ROMCU